MGTEAQLVMVVESSGYYLLPYLAGPFAETLCTLLELHPRHALQITYVVGRPKRYHEEAQVMPTYDAQT